MKRNRRLTCIRGFFVSARAHTSSKTRPVNGKHKLLAMRGHRLHPRESTSIGPDGIVLPRAPSVLAAIETRQLRPSGLSGPPPANVEFRPSSLRRHSESVHCGVKRPAVAQPSRQGKSVKAARGLRDPSAKAEVTHETSDSDAKRVAKLIEKLYDLNVQLQLAALNSSACLKVLDRQTKDCEQELDNAKKDISEKDKKGKNGRWGLQIAHCGPRREP